MNSLISPSDFRKQLAEYKKANPDKKRKIDPDLKRDLEHGWLLNYLMPLESMVWGRWAYWVHIQQFKKLPKEGIPQIEFNCGNGNSAEGGDSIAMKHLDECLSLICKYGSWQGWSGANILEYFLDWLLYGFGSQTQKELPKELNGCEGASMRLYQYFDLSYLVAYPWDYFGYLFSESNIGKGSAFFPTPHTTVQFMTMITMGSPSDQDSRLFSVCDPCVGTGRMLLYTSNYSMRGYGQDINPFCVKATMVNCYLYAPWFAKPLTVIDNLAKEAEALTGLSLEFQSLVKNKSLQSLIDPDNLAASRASGLLESINVDSIDWFSVI